MKSSSSWECKSRNLLLLENEKVEVFLSERMKKSSSSWERSLPLHENEKQWPVKMRLLLLLCSSVLGTGNKLHPACWPSRKMSPNALLAIQMCWNCVCVVWHTCDSHTKVSTNTGSITQGLGRPTFLTFSTYFLGPLIFSPRVATSYFTLNIAKNPLAVHQISVVEVDW